MSSVPVVLKDCIMGHIITVSIIDVNGSDFRYLKKNKDQQDVDMFFFGAVISEVWVEELPGTDYYSPMIIKGC